MKKLKQKPTAANKYILKGGNQWIAQLMSLKINKIIGQTPKPILKVKQYETFLHINIIT